MERESRFITFRGLVFQTVTILVALHSSTGSVSSPVVTMSSSTLGAVVLECESKGWYPEPEVLWLDGEGNLLSAGPTETVRGPDDLYTVSSRVTVEKTDDNIFTCRVQQNKTNQTTETEIHVPDDSFTTPSSSSSPASIFVGLLFGIIISVPAAVFVSTCIRNKIKAERPGNQE
ncbi:butyrophilin subfamily 2 member A1 isoform X4 [Lates calcarifer]|uniref:Butyrophilin subfamily 2 member A1 isoform X4 n=1 Tax=Lates calcarifer TaxID=8187 RepID=A0AAJ7PP77_LATCA|nr:butyrophilin subfamily 2 member A1 isoform X4 [Lates calcarifer]